MVSDTSASELYTPMMDRKPVRGYIIDTTKPRLVNWGVNLNLKQIYLTFDEAVDRDTVS